MIVINKYAALENKILEQLNNYITEEFGHIPIVQQTKWAIPDWTVLNLVNGEITSFCNIIERDVLIDHTVIKTAGLNNVITPRQFRGKSYSTKTLVEAEKFMFSEMKSELGLLLCADNLLPFYTRLNWYKVDCPVFYDQHGFTIQWAANVMLLSKEKKFAPTKIDLNGLPW